MDTSCLVSIISDWYELLSTSRWSHSITTTVATTRDHTTYCAHDEQQPLATYKRMCIQTRLLQCCIVKEESSAGAYSGMNLAVGTCDDVALVCGLCIYTHQFCCLANKRVNTMHRYVCAT